MYCIFFYIYIVFLLYRMYLNLFANSKLATQFMLALVVFEVKTHSPTQ